uniref:Serine/threonine-protein phosphatase 6 regulatory subunit 3-A n=1 Tax=Cacopsylla melanoneura TaxID=428564 RepID=A0A8D9A728_9HEMI
MFWKMNHASSAQIDTILCKDDLTLSELLDQESLLQEVVSQNKKLIDFLLRGDIMEELVTLITTEPPTHLPEKERYKQAHIACELLTSEMPVFNERLASDQTLLARLYAFLQNAHPLNPLLASFFSRTLGVLIARTSEQHWYSYQYSCLQVIEFLKSQEDCIELFLRHLSTSAIMDLLLKLVTNIEGQEIKSNVFTWLDEKQLIRQVCGKLDPSNSADDHDNAAQILIRIMDSLRRDDERSLLLQTTESEETIRLVLSLGLSPGSSRESGVTSCVEVLLQLLDVNNNNNELNKDPGPELKYPPEDPANTPDTGSTPPEPTLNPVVDKVIAVVVEFMPALHEFLTNPPPAAPIILNSGIIDPPLGFTRLSIIKLLRTLLSTQDSRIHDTFVSFNTFSILMDLFVQYPGNNFLHTEVEKCVQCALAESNSSKAPLPELVSSIFGQTRLTSRLLAAYRANEESEGKTNEEMSRRNSRKGYMGHLFSIANFVTVHLSPAIEDLLKGADLWTPWEEFVSGPLSKTNDLHAKCLGGIHPTLSTPDNNLDVPFSEDQAVFAADFTSSQAATKASNNSTYANNEGEEFGSNLIDAVRSQFSNDDITFNRNEELFLKLCDENLSDEKNNDESPLRFNNGLSMPQYWEKKWNDIDSSSDEEEEEEAPSAIASSLSYLSLSNNPADPWSSAGLTNGEQEGWADFDAAFSSFDVNGAGVEGGLPSDLTSTTASATPQQQQDQSNTMSTSISNGLDDHETELQDLEDDNKEVVEAPQDEQDTNKDKTAAAVVLTDEAEEITASNETEEESSRVNINEIHVIIDEEEGERQKPAVTPTSVIAPPPSTDTVSADPSSPPTQLTAVATIETTPTEPSSANPITPEPSSTNESSPSSNEGSSANETTPPETSSANENSS